MLMCLSLGKPWGIHIKLDFPFSFRLLSFILCISQDPLELVVFDEVRRCGVKRSRRMRGWTSAAEE